MSLESALQQSSGRFLGMSHIFTEKAASRIMRSHARQIGMGNNVLGDFLSDPAVFSRLMPSKNRLVGFLAINTFIGLAKGTQLPFYFFYKPESNALLLLAGVFADRTSQAELCHLAVFFRDLAFFRLQAVFYFLFGRIFYFRFCHTLPSFASRRSRF